MKQLRFVLFLIFLVLASVSIVLAHDDSCPAFVRATLENVTKTCEATGRDEACYGNTNLEATSRIEEFTFATPGDIENLNTVETLRLSSLSLADNIWGIALLKVQANIPDSSPKNVTMALFGDVEITNAVPPEIELEGTINTDANIRIAPNSEGAVVGAALVGTTLTAVGRNSDSSWLQIKLPENQGSGVAWVYAPLVDLSGDANTLRVVQLSAPHFGPIQAFYLTTGANDRPCDDAPDSGILIQTPDGVGEINFLVNEIEIRLGSTAFLQQHDNSMAITVVEGRADVTAEGATVTVFAGSQTTVPMTEARASGAPTFPEPYERDSLISLPLSLLPAEITIAEPLTPEEIEARLSPQPVDEAEETSQSNDALLPGTWQVDGTGGFCDTGSARFSNGSLIFGSGTLEVADDGSSFTFHGGNGVSTHSRVAPGVYNLTTSSPGNSLFNDFYSTVVNSPTSMTTTLQLLPGSDVDFPCPAVNGTATWTRISD